MGAQPQFALSRFRVSDEARSATPEWEPLSEALTDLLREALTRRGLLLVAPDGRGLVLEPLVLEPEIRQLRLASRDVPFAHLDLAVRVRDEHEPLYTRRVEVETRSRRGEASQLPRTLEELDGSSLGRAARACVESLAEAIASRYPGS